MFGLVASTVVTGAAQFFGQEGRWFLHFLHFSRTECTEKLEKINQNPGSATTFADWDQTIIIPPVRDPVFDSDTVGQLEFCDFLQVPVALLFMPSKLNDIASIQHLTVALFHVLRICSLGRACLAALVGFTLQLANREFTQGLQQVGIVISHHKAG